MERFIHGLQTKQLDHHTLLIKALAFSASKQGRTAPLSKALLPSEEKDHKPTSSTKLNKIEAPGSKVFHFPLLLSYDAVAAELDGWPPFEISYKPLVPLPRTLP